MHLRWSLCLCFLVGFRALFTGPASMEFNKYKFKTESHDTIYIFKNYFAAMFSAINFSIFSNKRYPNTP